jgi:hypothetical protein
VSGNDARDPRPAREAACYESFDGVTTRAANGVPIWGFLPVSFGADAAQSAAARGGSVTGVGERNVQRPRCNSSTVLAVGLIVAMGGAQPVM